MLTYLFDTSVVVEFYQPKAVFRSETYRQRSNRLRQRIARQKTNGDAVLFVPSFCVAEVCNTFAKWYYRPYQRKRVFTCKADYERVRRTFIGHVHDRKFFYSYDLKRYHNLNAHEVYPIEHTTDTEFDASGLPIGSAPGDVRDALEQQRKQANLSRYYLSTFDILIIAMGMELKRLYGSSVYLLSADKRLLLISDQDKRFPTPLNWRRITTRDLPKP